jgi:hypothetical protein
MNRRLTTIALATALAASAAVLPTAASANTATIGSALTLNFDSNACTAGCVAVQESQVGGSSPYPLTSPANGIVTQWAIASGDSGAIFSLRILRPAGPSTYTAAGTAVAPTADPGLIGTILRYPASLPIRQGDAIGVSGGGDSDAGVPQHDTTGVAANVMATTGTGQGLAEGATAVFTPVAQHELLLQATVRFCSVPALKRLKKVTAKQQLAASDCGVKVKKRPTHKRKFRGKVLKQKTPPGTTAAPGTVVPIVIGIKD